jgi:hypothetical protein
MPAGPSEGELRRYEAATWGANLDAQPNRANRRTAARQARLRKWTPRPSGALMTGKNGPWIALPARKQLDRDGNLRVEAKGKALFNQITEFRDRAGADQFSALVLSLIRAQYPEDLDD